MTAEIKIVGYDPEDYGQVVSMFKDGTYEHIYHGIQNGWRKPKVQLFMGSSILILPYSLKYALIWFLVTWFCHVAAIASSYLAYVRYHMKSDMQDQQLKFWTTLPNELWVAKIGQNTVGMIAYQVKDASTVELNRLSVDTKFRRLGIAKQLIDHLLKGCKSQNYKRVTLTTSVNQMGVHTLYEKIGFKFSKNVTKGGFASDFISGVRIVEYIYDF